MSSVFTEYIRRLEPDRDGPDESLCMSVWQTLRGALIGEMKSRGLWSAPPSYLGVYEGANWSQEGTLDELLAECYSFIFVRRLRGLKAQLEIRDNVDGLVFLNVRHFLFDTQKKHDPLGFRVFDVVRSAVLRSIAADVLYVWDGDPQVRNDTILGFSAAGDANLAASADLAVGLRAWNDELLPDLVTARGNELEPVLGVLTGLLAALSGEGIEAFRFKDLIDPLKSDARHRWSALWLQAEGETALNDGDEASEIRVRLVHPDSSTEERQSFEALVACVTEALGRIPVPAKTRTYLEKLWVFERNQCAESTGKKPLSRRKMGDVLGIPRHRLPELYETLGRLVEGCRGRSAALAQTSESRLDAAHAKEVRT